MNKNFILAIVILFNACITSAQNFDKIATLHLNNGIPVNKTDSLNRKQGKWIHYKMCSFSQNVSHPTGVYDTSFTLFSKGEYVNNHKIGKWEYYNDNRFSFETDRFEIYSEDGSVNRIKKYPVQSNGLNHENTLYNKDSSLITSEITLQTIGTVCIKCINKDKCTATFKKKVVLSFSFDLFDIKREKFCNGFYSRDLRLNQKIMFP
jgi:hypothetical protein